jgi:hypothetical protein
MNFKQLDLELKQLTEKHKSLLPKKYNLPSNEITFIERLSYIEKNETFQNELTELKQRFINEHGINSISEKEAFIYMFSYYKRNLENGSNSLVDKESYQLRFGNHNH